MPLPKPRKKEPKEKFISRCMANDITNRDYPDNSQRYAVCLSQWNRRKKKNNPETNAEETK